MPLRSGVDEHQENTISAVSMDSEINLISVNLSAICQELSSVSSVSTVSLGNVLERCAAALEELRTLNELIGSEADEVREGLRLIDAQLKRIDNIWENIDNTVKFVAQKKKQLYELEKLCTYVENSQKHQ